MRLVKAELRKLTTTHLWWILLLTVVVSTALAFLINAVSIDLMLTQMPSNFDGMSPAEVEQARANMMAQIDVVPLAANLYTSGQYFALLFAMILGILLVTSEYFHQTATTTFLTTPRRSRVIAAKLGVAVLWGVGLWVITTVLSIVAGAIFLSTQHIGTQLGEWIVIRSILLNLLAYVVWATLGVGFGTLIRSQIGAVVTALVLYVIGTTAARAAIELIAQWLDAKWIEKFQILVPSIASNLMITGGNLASDPPQWVGAAILIGYAVLIGGIGVSVTQRRDIS
jgi:ABC-type transport system involved in multi-copper enzyme maturation permease subunit